MASPDRPPRTGPPRPDDLSGWTLSIQGLVDQPATLGLKALARLEQVDVESDVRCPEGGGVAGHVHRGVPLADVLAGISPGDGASHVLVVSGAFVVAFSLESLARRGAILALERDGRPLTWEEGGPVRLVPGKGACFDSVKWVQKLELAASGERATAIQIIRDRRGIGPRTAG